jgi:hypothetical protein
MTRQSGDEVPRVGSVLTQDVGPPVHEIDRFADPSPNRRVANGFHVDTCRAEDIVESVLPFLLGLVVPTFDILNASVA